MTIIYIMIKKIYYVMMVPLSIFFILNSKLIHNSYNMTFFKKITLGLMMFINTLRIPTATSYKAHLAMALKILETPPDMPGNILECGTYKGGSAANLSLISKIVGRKLLVYDSFEGLPEGKEGDREAKHYKKGEYSGTIDEVKSNIQRCGAIECCEFIEGCFDDTLPMIDSPVLLAFLDVDLEASLNTCVKHIWPRVVENGYIFIDEFASLDYCALFFSEKWWDNNFGILPPGLIGAGIGLAMGDYYIGPYSEKKDHPMQHGVAGAYTRKGMTGYWAYYPAED